MEIMKPHLEIVMQFEAVVEPPHAPNELKVPTENEKGFVRYDIFRVVPH